MITDPKVGDVVYFAEPANWSNWFDTKPGVRYQIIELPEPEGRDEDHIPVRLGYLKTGEIPGNCYACDTGVWTDWLARDEFLSAAYHAKEEHASRTKRKTKAARINTRRTSTSQGVRPQMG